MENPGSLQKKREILAVIWEYLMERGLSKASVGDLCKSKRLSQSSLYYWFKDKDDIWISAGKYGCEKVALSVLDHTIDHVNDVNTYFETLFDEVDKYKDDLRLVVQLTTSPVFGEAMRHTMYSFNPMYERYGLRLMEMSGCTPVQAETFIYTVIAIIVDYVIWDDREKSKMLLDAFHKRTLKILESLNK